MALEKLKSIFTEGMKEMHNSDVTSMGIESPNSFNPPELANRIGTSLFNVGMTMMYNSDVTSIGAESLNPYNPPELVNKIGTSDFGNLDSLRIGSGTENDNNNNFTFGMGPPEAQYLDRVYDPRISRGRDTITIGTYKGTRLTKSGFMPGSESGIGGLFNMGANISPLKKYSLSFRDCNVPSNFTFFLNFLSIESIDSPGLFSCFAIKQHILKINYYLIVTFFKGFIHC